MSWPDADSPVWLALAINNAVYSAAAAVALTVAIAVIPDNTILVVTLGLSAFLTFVAGSVFGLIVAYG